jgi:hypothetical protein
MSLSEGDLEAARGPRSDLGGYASPRGRGYPNNVIGGRCLFREGNRDSAFGSLEQKEGLRGSFIPIHAAIR